MLIEYYEFGPYRILHRDRNLLRGDQIVSVTPRQFDTLWAIVSGEGKPVSKEQLLAEVWVATPHIAESNVTTQIRSLRKILGLDESGQEYIRTIPNKGYYIPSVISSAEREAPPPSAEVSDSLTIKGSMDGPPAPSPAVPVSLTVTRSRSRLQLGLLIAGLLIAAVSATALLWHGREPRKNRLAIAVLPFEYRTGLPGSQNLARIVTEMMRTEAGGGANLRVIDAEDTERAVSDLSLRTGSGFGRTTLAGIRNRLECDFLVQGDVVRLGSAAADIRIDFSIQDARSGEILTSESATSTEASLFDSVARLGLLLRSQFGAGALRADEAESLRQERPANLDAARYYADGISRLRAFQPLQARADLEQALKYDGRSALIHSALAECQASLGYETLAAQEASRAYELSRAFSRENQLLVEGRFRELNHQWARAIELYEALWTFFPDDGDYALRLIAAQLAAGQATGARTTLGRIEATRASLSRDPRITFAEAEIAENAGNYNEEFAAAQQAIQEADRRHDRWLAARAKLKACWALDYLGRRTEAKALAEGARATFQKLGDRGGEAQALKNIADVLDDGGDHERAIPLYRQSVDEFEQIGSETGAAVTLNNMGYALKDMGDFDAAGRAFGGSIDICRRTGDRRREALALNGQAGILARKGRLAEAKQEYEQALAGFQESGQEDRAATVLSNLALLLQDEGRLGEAQERLERALEIERSKGDQTAIARTLRNLGEIRLARGELSAASADFEEQLAIGKRIGEDKQQAYALGSLGRLYWERADGGRARASLELALRMQEKAGEKDLALETRMALDRIEPANLSDLRAIAEAFRKENRPDQEALALAAFAVPGALADPPGNVIKRLNELLPSIEDYEIRLAVRAALARHDIAQVRSVINDAGLRGYTILELNESLVLAEMRENGAERQRLIEEVDRRAQAGGLRRIAALSFALTSKNEPQPAK